MLYVLLASKYPFDPDCDDTQLEAAIQRCECVLFLPFPSPAEPLSAFSSIRRFDRAALDTVSHAARSLVFGLLELDPSRRLTAQQALQQNTVEWVREVSENRSFRLTTVSRSLVSLVWVLILLGTVVAIIFPWFFGTVNVVAHGLMSAILVSFLMVHLVVILHLAYPFVGETAISPSAFLAVAQ